MVSWNKENKSYYSLYRQILNHVRHMNLKYKDRDAAVKVTEC